MIIALQNNGAFVLRFDRGEEVLSSLQEFCAESDIGAAWFSGIGACGELTISWFDLEAREYRDREIADQLEIVSLTGNMSRMGNEIILHAHGVFSGADYATVGGHVDKMVVSGTCEIFFTVLEGPLERAFDEETGLNLLQESENLKNPETSEDAENANGES